MSEMRKTLVRQQGKWIEKSFKDLNKGENFKLFEPNGEQIFAEDGEYIFCANSLPYFCQDLEAWMVETF